MHFFIHYESYNIDTTVNILHYLQCYTTDDINCNINKCAPLKDSNV